ncbi:5-oxoprolinase subunit PxpB [Aneurinibacillus sp. Ricciae_BoGa-3]|uniref:5-oxoprolinase subunit PxpB n=1 Tax=Aneurinibacillus sp. Ricciae_BoGa-3 TaxID=3022697 RepID=UPI002340B42E|nr:5-oxoprolinase subunit PxpB [Aneurinibacillus sp. Ricciae_BoGa-3]WCK56912.1 5-oxoprolinase subunit PxpB [Aneurinibacillus sp. Ricciae_BoGa-3]
MEFTPLGDSAVVMRVGNTISEETQIKVSNLCAILDKYPFNGMIEYVPAFTTVTVYYNPVIVYAMASGENENTPTPYSIVCSLLQNILQSSVEAMKEEARVVEIPVCYGEELGPDLEFVAKHNGITEEEVIEIHTGNDYLVYMIGFAPGFPFMGGMSEKIAAPRLASPRLAIPAGSVGIAGMQTGVYPIETPGGWRLIGQTPLALFKPEDNPPSLLRAGDHVRFRQISRLEFDKWKEAAVCK